MAKMTGGEALARTLKAAGVEYIFGIAVGSQAPFTLGAMRLGMQTSYPPRRSWPVTSVSW